MLCVNFESIIDIAVFWGVFTLAITLRCLFGGSLLVWLPSLAFVCLIIRGCAGRTCLSAKRRKISSNEMGNGELEFNFTLFCCYFSAQAHTDYL